MDAPAPPLAPPACPRPLSEALEWIEARLDGPLTLAEVADRAGLSPYHFSRLFTAWMGHSVMAHVRGRKLVRAARRLVADPDLKLIDLALDSGFESQEAFTRAFKRLFGVAPGRFRRGFAVTPIEGQFPMTAPRSAQADVVRLPGVFEREAFSVIGFSRRFDEDTKSAIPQLWSRLVGLLPAEGQVESWDTYGLVWDVELLDASFTYMAAVGLKPDAATPPGFERKDLAAAPYAVFRITLSGAAVHPQIKAAMRTIWGELFPATGLKVADAPDFELYDGQFAPDRPGAVIDFYVPVVV